MTYAVGAKVELHGSITASSDSSFTVGVTEILIGSEFYNYTTTYSLTLDTSLFTTSLSPTELALLKKLAIKYQNATDLTSEEVVAAKSVITKLS